MNAADGKHPHESIVAIHACTSGSDGIMDEAQHLTPSTSITRTATWYSITSGRPDVRVREGRIQRDGVKPISKALSRYVQIQTR